VMKLGDTVDLVVVSFNPSRRSIDLCVPGMEPADVKTAAAAPVKRTRKKAVPPADATISRDAVAAGGLGAREKPAKRTRTKNPPAVAPAPETPSSLPPTAAKRTRKKAAAPADEAISRDAVAAGGSGAREKPAKQTGKQTGKKATTSGRSAAKGSPQAPTKAASAPTKAAPAPATRSRKKAAS
jgi:hypothetical protein